MEWVHFTDEGFLQLGRQLKQTAMDIAALEVRRHVHLYELHCSQGSHFEQKPKTEDIELPKCMLMPYPLPSALADGTGNNPDGSGQQKTDT